ncbi:hypothetical protein [Flammeovirga kamogawensis]|uniref:Uncharacterized protein n=1 Tax=Flammeovirga kamogawensis TaxID=373891 RepID=A0ABX8H310_9BACT|nr:hypothetical protein [Flammeovirga kamogawensis]MBB6460493.1 hypothetical protein [Flammeovirga kamogawensis]QWG10299.1 hypothetical protein KM029_21690 [Flammeovirga kamogawensis]TRX64747.1 hypothetical protein EO216_19610 [Flammeovirga kamogawensis]
MVKQHPIFLLLIFFVLSCSPPNKEQSKREEINLKRDWTFTFSEKKESLLKWYISRWNSHNIQA